MGSNDVFCCLCSALASKPSDCISTITDESNEDYGCAYDPRCINEDDMDWMDDIRIIGRNAKTNMCFITGPATYELGSSDMYYCEPGDDLNCPTAAQLRLLPGKPGQLTVYCHPLKYLELKSFPFHSACYQVLSRALARMDPSDTLSDCHVENIDIEALCSTFEKLHRDWDPRLNLDYGDIGNSVEQYWDAYHGYEALVSNPGDIEELSKYYEHLPQMKFRLPRTFPPQEGVAIHITPSKEYRYTADPFAVFPPEVLLELSTYLPVKSLRAFRSASPAARNTRLTNMFWWKHIIMEMPWLWDIPPSPRNSAESMIDWKQVFEDLSMRSQDHFTQECQENRLERDPRKETILGLVNRRRIWEPCCEIAKLYFELRSTNNSD